MASPRYCHYVSFIWCFGYIAFFRTTHYFGLPMVPPHANAIQLLLTLRMVGLAFEVHDTDELERRIQTVEPPEEPDVALTAQHRCQSVQPSFVDVFLYGFCYIGLLTGPYYKYRTYYDMVHQRNALQISIYEEIKSRMKSLAVVVPIFLICSYYFNIQTVRSEAFYDWPLIYRLLYMVPMFVVFRTRLYCAWMLSEMMCVTARLGAYPVQCLSRCGQGPTDYIAAVNVENDVNVEYNFETIHNIDIYGSELSPTVREGMRSWNMTVQHWLASNVYKRVPVRDSFIRVAVTMAVSAFWHGVHPGYYLSFLTIPFNLAAEDIWVKKVRRNSAPPQQQMFDWVCWFCKMRSFDYMCMGFLLLTLSDTLKYWYSIYFIGHVFIISFITVGQFLPSIRAPHQQ